MPKGARDLQFLLIEARQSREMVEHELSCLARAAGVDPSQFTVHDCLAERPTTAILRGYDAVFIGGTGDYSVANDRPFFHEPLVETTLALLDRGTPTVGLCYGFHLMAVAVGGLVECRPDLEETGTYEIYLTEHGKKDAILGGLPERFLAQQGHHDVVTFLPDDFVCLAASQRCRYQAFRHAEKPYYGLQFHPELSRADFMLRMQIYASSYASTPERYAEIDAQVKETHNQDVVKRFLERIVLGKDSIRS